MDYKDCQYRAGRTTMRSIKTIDELYDEVREYDLVITNDASLATALNRMVDAPRIDSFALTPQQIASKTSSELLGEAAWRELKTAISVSKETGLDFRYVHSVITYIEEVCRHTRDVEKHLHSKRSRKVYESYAAIPTVQKAMRDFDYDATSLIERHAMIAVIGLDACGDWRYDDVSLFNDFDKRFIPSEYDEISIYKDGDYELSPIYAIGNDRQLAENAADLIDPEKSTDYAVVIKTDSPIADAIRSEFYRRGIPFVNDLTVRDLNQVRDYVQFLKLSLSYTTLRVKHIREMFSSLHASVPLGIDEHLVSKTIFSGDAEEYATVMEKVRDYTFDEVRGIVFDTPAGTTVSTILKDIGIAESKITSKLVDSLSYAVDNVSDLKHNEQIPENEKEGVLIADCSRSMYIDRPVIIFVGMGQDWNVDFSEKKYVEDKDAETARNAIRLEVMLQQGEQRFYLVNTSKNGKDSVPTSLFNTVFARPVRSFADIAGPEGMIVGRWHEKSEKATPELDGRIENPIMYDRKFSKTSLAAYTMCPRRFMFDNLLKSENKVQLEFGNLVHEFAELCVAHHDLVEENGIEYFVELLSERFSGISSPMRKEVDKQSIRCVLINTMRYIESRDAYADPDMPLGKRRSDSLFSLLNPPVTDTSSHCECDLESECHSIHGKMDLITDNTVIDYKSGKMKSADDIVKYLEPKKSNNYVDIQAPLYLAIAIEKGIGNGEFELFYAKGHDTEYAEEDFDIETNVRRVLIHSMSQEELACHPATIRLFGKRNIKYKYGKRPGVFVEVLQRSVSGSIDSWPDDEKAISALMNEFDYDHGEKTKVQDGIRSLVEIVKNGIINDEDTVLISHKRLDDFLESVDGMHEKMMRESITIFPPDSIAPCKRSCEYYSVCTICNVDMDSEGESDD